LDVSTGYAGNNVNVLSTGVMTSIGNGCGRNYVSVGSAGSVQGILGTLILEGAKTLTVDDSADETAQAVTLGTWISGGNNFGSITGLSWGAIEYSEDYHDAVSTSILNLTTGRGGDTVNVLATYAATNLSSSGGADTVNVGAGSVKDIVGALSIENPLSLTTININDSADPTSRTASLNTIVPFLDPVPWGSITRLAPAAISFEYSDVRTAISISNSPGTVAWNVNSDARGWVVGVIVYDNGKQIN
jgi:hypothetical protein